MMLRIVAFRVTSGRCTDAGMYGSRDLPIPILTRVLRGFALYRSWNTADENLIDTFSIHVDNLEPISFSFEYVTAHRNTAHLKHHESTERVVAAGIFIRKLRNFEQFFEIIDRDLAINQP